MLRDTAIDIILKRCGNRTSTTLKQGIINEMVFVQENILEGNADFRPWFTLTEFAEGANASNDERLPLPNDFIEEWEDGALWRYDEDADEAEQWIEMIRDDYKIIKAKYPESGVPTHYDKVVLNDENYDDQAYYLLKPTPTIQYVWKMRYYGKGEGLAGTYGDAANIENIWLKHASDWFIGEVGMIIAAQHLQSETLAQMFMAQSQRGYERVYKKHIQWLEVNKNRQMGDQ